jgi:hypothetical protein
VILGIWHAQTVTGAIKKQEISPSFPFFQWISNQKGIGFMEYLKDAETIFCFRVFFGNKPSKTSILNLGIS